MAKDPIKGEGWAVASVDDLGDGPGFRKVRAALGITAFGANAVVLPPGYVTPRHFHERQEELYLVLDGEIEIEFGDGTTQTLSRGGMARVSPETLRRMRNPSTSEDATYFCVGGAGGYVGRDGVRPDEPDLAGR
jgi:quercetin dioxygenase-like cupin family protein